MEMEKIREAVEYFRKFAIVIDSDIKEQVEPLLSLAASILQSSGEIPQKAFVDYPDTPEGRQAKHENQLYNKGIDECFWQLLQYLCGKRDCTLYLARKEMEHSDKCETMAIDRVEKLAPFLVKVVMEKYGGLIDIGSDLTDLAQAILDYLGKGE